MAKHQYGAQSYQVNGHGDLERAKSEPCLNAEDAKRKAARMVDRAGAIGAAAFFVPNYTFENGGDDPIIIAAFGEVPTEVSGLLA